MLLRERVLSRGSLVASGSSPDPSHCLAHSHPPARAHGSSSSSGHFVVNIVGNSQKYLDYEQESVQAREEEKD